MRRFPKIIQLENKDCGPTCLQIIGKYYKKNISISVIRNLAGTTRTGSSLLNLSDTAEKLGFKTIGVKCDFQTLKLEVPLPCIVHWNQKHFAVVYKISDERINISDPAIGLLEYTKEEFLKSWIGNKYETEHTVGIALVVEPTPKLYTNVSEEDEKYNLNFISKYLFSYKNFFIQLILALLTSSLLQLVFPFLTQSIVDVGITNHDIGFVYLILVSQVFLFMGKTSVDIIRSWILLHLSTRINVSILSDFFIKLMKLPISYFDTRDIGDILQRIYDHRRIERILTSSSLNVLFSLISLFIFGFVLFWYSGGIFLIFLGGSLAYFLWILLFLKKREDLDYKTFGQLSTEQSNIVEIISGMQEIKLHNAEKMKRWSWEHLQARLFKLSQKSLALEQYQSVGSSFINELKNILITAFSATLVINGDLTLGMMLAISYIVGQLNNPILQLIDFTREWQDAKIAINRLGEIHNKKDELQIERGLSGHVPDSGKLEFRNVTFSYPGNTDPVVRDISFEIPFKKVTAIVGPSGSGKTTLLKLLLKFYNPSDGTIFIAENDLTKITQRAWRANCGVVMQDGYIFNDSIAKNVALGHESVDNNKLMESLEMARIADFVRSLPKSYHTKIGTSGTNLSAGEKQRLLIARAIYKDPQYLFFDEATSALDAENENKIVDNLNTFFKNRTVVIIAHRLSTVKNADQILVLSKGGIIERGTHTSLVNQNGVYFNLVKNQLDLGK